MKTFKLKIDYSRSALKFLTKNSQIITEDEADVLIVSAVKKLLKIEDNNIDIIQLHGARKGSFRVKTGKVRIIFTLSKGEVYVAFVDKISFRKDAYK
ncbi:MAG: hypothetical protein HQK57_02560 [Deltaproteobacteria bacterium]|nr:hypothetical protein [Deltaproteobacteria bacterium]MBF0524598.1 hypothetical protein [Deltaproteobacteria bacterium]